MRLVSSHLVLFINSLNTTPVVAGSDIYPPIYRFFYFGILNDIL